MLDIYQNSETCLSLELLIWLYMVTESVWLQAEWACLSSSSHFHPALYFRFMLVIIYLTVSNYVHIRHCEIVPRQTIILCSFSAEFHGNKSFVLFMQFCEACFIARSPAQLSTSKYLLVQIIVSVFGHDVKLWCFWPEI